ncbi:MAG: response regulator [Acidobacteria bacterium]|nr:response regulator [Acidobacteriota bacterium]
MDLTFLAHARILIVDDQASNLALLARLLASRGYGRASGTTDPREALRRLTAELPDLLVLDLHMPGVDGFEVLEHVRALTPPGEFFPILVITGDRDPAVRERALLLGARDFVSKPFNSIEILLRIHNLLETRFLQRQLTTHNRELETLVRLRTQELEESRLEILERLALASEYRDDDTGEHTRRVGAWSARIAHAMALGPAQVELIERAAPLHDVGKIGLPDAVLLKPGRVSADEFAIIKTHTTIGARILSGSQVPLLQLAEEIARSHHERYDGDGYPDHLAGDDIPLAGRIVAVADAYDAMTHERPYRTALSPDDALAAIDAQRGRQFDPDVSQTFFRLLERRRRVRQSA